MSSFCNQMNTSACLLEHVDISENKINDDCERELADALGSKSLKRMILKGNSLFGAGKAILDAVLANPNITHVDLQANFIDINIIYALDRVLQEHRDEKVRQVAPLLSAEKEDITHHHVLHWTQTQKAIKNAKLTLLFENKVLKEE